MRGSRDLVHHLSAVPQCLCRRSPPCFPPFPRHVSPPSAKYSPTRSGLHLCFPHFITVALPFPSLFQLHLLSSVSQRPPRSPLAHRCRHRAYRRARRDASHVSSALLPRLLPIVLFLCFATLVRRRCVRYPPPFFRLVLLVFPFCGLCCSQPPSLPRSSRRRCLCQSFLAPRQPARAPALSTRRAVFFALSVRLWLSADVDTW